MMDLEIHGHRGAVSSDLRPSCDCGWVADQRFTSHDDAGAHWMREHALPSAEAVPPNWLLVKSDVLREQVQDMIRTRPTTALKLLAEIEAWQRPLTEHAVASARGAGASWEEIGGALGVSRQAVHERFRHVEKAKTD